MDTDRLAALLASGMSWRGVSRAMGVPRSSLHLALAGGRKTSQEARWQVSDFKQPAPTGMAGSKTNIIRPR